MSKLSQTILYGMKTDLDNVIAFISAQRQTGEIPTRAEKRKDYLEVEIRKLEAQIAEADRMAMLELQKFGSEA